MVSFLRSRGYDVLTLPYQGTEDTERDGDLPRHSRWLGDRWEVDAEQTSSILVSKGDVDVLIVDHYALDYRWEQEMRSYAGNIVVIDDLADRGHDCDILLDQNLYPNAEARYDGKVPDKCKLLLGPRYALLREQFVSTVRDYAHIPEQPKRIFVFFGGSDPTDETSKTIEALSSLQGHGLHVDVVVGSSNPYQAKVMGLCERNGFHYYCQVNDMAGLMAQAHLSIGAGGVTTWERCSLGLPSLVVSVAENQEILLEGAKPFGLFLYLGKSDQVSAAQIARSVEELLFTTTGEQILREISVRGREYVNGRGCDRVADTITALRLQ